MPGDDTGPRRPLPTDPLQLRQDAEAALTRPGGEPNRELTAIALALLAIAGELAAIRRSTTKGR